MKRWMYSFYIVLLVNSIMAGKKSNPWLIFLKQFRAKNPKMSMKDQMKKGAVQYRAQKAKSTGKSTGKAKRKGKKNGGGGRT